MVKFKVFGRVTYKAGLGLVCGYPTGVCSGCSNSFLYFLNSFEFVCHADYIQ